MSSRIGIVNYGVGNIKSVANALIAIGVEPVVSADRDELSGCDRLILPGVGAFAHGMGALQERDLVGFLRDQAGAGKPLLGICLGMQLLTAFSTEFGHTEGLGLIEGGIYQMRAPEDTDVDFRLPNVGWLELAQTGEASGLAAQMLDPVTPGSRFYFIHSYIRDAEIVQTAAVTEYHGVRFASMVSYGSVIGTQFHPEKSGSEGLKMLKNFIL
jgi:glutamine amidotransferase